MTSDGSFVSLLCTMGTAALASFRSCYNATMQDAPRHATPQPDTGELRHTLSVHDVEAALVAAGVPRSHRQVVRYCETGMLDAVKVPGPTGAQWYVSPASLPKAIGDLTQWQAQRARHGTPQPDMSDRVSLETSHNGNPDTASHGTPQPAVSQAPDKEKSGQGSETEPAMARYVQQLEKRIDEKDDVIVLLKDQLTAKDQQIGELSTRYRETHTLLGAMQRMLAPMLGQPDPYTPEPEKREATSGVDNPKE